MSEEININDKSYYGHFDKNVKDETTKQRLQEIKELGLKEVGIGEFGIPGKMSGLYIERVWNYNDSEWKDYIDWIKTDIITK